MPNNVEPFQPKDGPHRSLARRRVTRGCKVGGEPHLVTLRDRRATAFLRWPGLGDAGEHHADDAQGRVRASTSSEYPDPFRRDARNSAAPYVAPLSSLEGEAGLLGHASWPVYAVKEPALPPWGRVGCFCKRSRHNDDS